MKNSIHISKVYSDYKILPSLRLHMYRVAAVAAYICDKIAILSSADKQDILEACLLHDIGNIIKFDLTLFPEFLEPEGLDYWQGVKKEYLKKYGADEHVATQEIARELNVSVRTQGLIEAVGFSKMPATAISSDLAAKIMAYADTRVGPSGVMSLVDRETAGKDRFKRNKPGVKYEDARFEEYFQAAEEVEKQVCKLALIAPEQINDEAIRPYIEVVQAVKLIVD